MDDETLCFIKELIDKSKKDNDYDNNRYFQAIDKLLDGYNKEQNRADKLSEHMDQFYKGELFTAQQLKFVEQVQNKTFIRKDIVEHELELLQKDEDCTYCNNCCSKFLACQTLKKLLSNCNI